MVVQILSRINHKNCFALFKKIPKQDLNSGPFYYQASTLQSELSCLLRQISVPPVNGTSLNRFLCQIEPFKKTNMCVVYFNSSFWHLKIEIASKVNEQSFCQCIEKLPSLFALPKPLFQSLGLGLQAGGHGRANMRV